LANRKGQGLAGFPIKQHVVAEVDMRAKHIENDAIG
jgi:hypothetical protein